VLSSIDLHQFIDDSDRSLCYFFLQHNAWPWPHTRATNQVASDLRRHHQSKLPGCHLALLLFFFEALSFGTTHQTRTVVSLMRSTLKPYPYRFLAF
jgi:hypothetical protein